jgi:SNF2 family DNA or RNA helicase
MKLLIRPDEHQMDGVKFLVKRKAGMLNYETGSGKSVTLSLASFYLLVNGLVDKILIVCPKGATISFYDDFKDHTDTPVDLLLDKEAVKKFFANPKSLIGVVKYNFIDDYVEPVKDVTKKTVTYQLKPDFKRYFLENKIAVLFDEFHALKNPDSQMRQNYDLLRPLMSRVYAVTATIYMTDLYDLYWLVQYLHPVFKNKTEFTRNFVNVEPKEMRLPGGAKRIYNDIVGYKNLDYLTEMLKDLVLFFDAGLDIRKEVFQTTLSDDSMSDYKLAAEGFLDCDGTEKSFSARMLDLQRVVNSDYSKKQLLRDKIQALRGFGVVIYCEYETSVVQVQEVLSGFPGLTIFVIDGSVSVTKRKKIKDSFHQSPENTIVIVMPAGAQSLNLHATNHLVCYDIPTNVGRYDQLKGRIARMYSKYDVFYVYMLMVTDTIDEYKHERLDKMLSVFKKVVGIGVQTDLTIPSFNFEVLSKLKKKFLWKPKFRQVKKVNRK